MTQAATPTADLENKPVGRLLLEYSIPAVIATTISSLYNIISGVFIGYGVGPLALTGLAVSFPLFNLLGALCMLVAVGGAAQCSLELGRGNDAGATLVLGHVVVLELIASAACAAGFLLFLEPVLRLFGASEETLPYARDYMEVLLYGTPVGFVMLALNSILRASGYPSKAMVTAMVSVGVSVVLTPLFIFVFGWGMRGAGLATVISQAVAAIWILVHFFRKDSVVRFRKGIFRLRRAVTSPILAIGLAPFLMNACSCVVVIVINTQLRIYGGDLAIGAYGILNRVLMLFAMVVMGLTQGMQPIIGFNYGAQRSERVTRTLWYGIVISTLISLAGFIIFEAFPRFLARMFTDNAELINLAVDGVRLTGAVFFLVGPQIVISSFFQAIGMPGIAIFLALSRQLLFLIPGLLLLPLWLGLNGVWISLPFADTLAFVVTVVILWRRARRMRPKQQ